MELGTSKALRIFIKEQLLTGKKNEEVYGAIVDGKRQKKSYVLEKQLKKEKWLEPSRERARGIGSKLDAKQYQNRDIEN